MPATEIPPKAPPPQLSNSDLYDAARWEHVYRELHNVPELLVQLQDDLSRARKREALWISVIFHLAIAILLINSGRFIHLRQIAMQLPTDKKDLTYLELPPDEQKLTKRPNTNIISDKDRIATSRTPQLDTKQLHKILDSARPGAPGVSAPPPTPQVAPQQQQQAAAQPQQQPQPQQQQQQSEPQQPAPDANQSASLHMPAQQPRPSFGNPNLSAGSAIEQAARAAAASRGAHYGDGGDYGLGQGRQAAKALGNLDVLSDTMGVDFGPYLKRVLDSVKTNWYTLIPESARAPLMKKGKVSIEFAILKDGRIAGMTLTGPSGDVALDRAAWGGITQSGPFPALPAEFRGNYLALRFHFYYNPDSSDLQ